MPAMRPPRGQVREAMSKLLHNRYLIWCARWLLGLLFIASALGKIADPAGFASNVAAYRLLPMQAVNAFAIVLPWVEFLVGLALLNGIASRSGALLAIALNLMFLVAVGSAMGRGLDIDCGCVTVVKSTVGWGLIARDMMLLALSLLVLRRPLARQRD